MTAGADTRRRVRAALDAGAVFAAVAFVASHFPASLLFSPTTANGGDMGSHYYAATYLRDMLLPQGRLLGWCPGNYGGFPLFGFYFPLPFLLMAIFSAIVPLQVAFKLVTVLGSWLLPACAYFGLRFSGVAFPGPALGAFASLCFLFMEANSMWGGNIPSTLAGEFSFSLSLALAILFIGTLRRSIETGRGFLGNAVLVALIGLAHGFSLLWAGLVSLLELIAIRGWWRRLGGLITVHGLAVLLMAFWLLPLLWYASWGTAFNPTWPLTSWREVLPPILWPATVLAVIFGLLHAVFCWRRRESYPRALGTLWGAVALSLFCYASAHAFHLPDVRFLSFLQLGLCLAGAAGLGLAVSRLPAPEVWPVIGFLATVPFVQAQVGFIPSWVRWNYSGFESKARWPVYREINRHLEGDFRDPRVVYEHSPRHEAFGTVRAFENLPVFSGRSTLEGLYMQSSPTTPFVFYVQSEISQQISCPLPEWGCSRFDLDQGLEHLRMFNVSQLIVRSPEVKQAAASHPGLSREATVDQYEIYRVLGNDGRYAIPLAWAPTLLRVPQWKVAAYQWFKGAAASDPVPVFANRASDQERQAFAGVFADLPAELPRRPLGEVPRLQEEIEPHRVVLTGCKPGHPVLIRISYHPRWRALTGERVWLAGPSFMLVFPRGEKVELAFVPGPILALGKAGTVIGLLILGLGLSPFAGPLWRLAERASQPLLGVGPVARGLRFVRRSATWPRGKRQAVLFAGLVTVSAALTLFAVARPTMDAGTVYRQGQALFAAGRLEESLPYFRRSQQLAPLSMTAIHAHYFEAIVHFKREEWSKAEEVFQHLLERFPEAANAPEAFYHLGLCRARRGDVDAAIEAWRETARRFPEADWARYAEERLREDWRTDGQ